MITALWSHQPNATVGDPPISGPGKPSLRSAGPLPTPPPSPLRLAGGGKHSPRGGHFYFALPPDISIPVDTVLSSVRVFSNPDMSMNKPVGGAEGGCEGEW